MGVTIWQNLAERTAKMIERAFDDIKSREDWLRARPQRHQDFMRSLGLAPLPERCDSKVTEYGGFEGQGFRARRIAYQIMPDCWGSACFYYPDPMPKDAAPGVLYVCGHSPTGSHPYQYHPVMWARRGYVCLIIDTIEQNDNPGEHSGALMGCYDAWRSMGYTSSGGEVWNAMRALDVLAADPRVDPNRLGVTGVSGGGACSFHLAIADERIKAVSTLCGICSPYDAVHNRHVVGHCDCMFPYNIFQRDIAEYAALIAPRAVLFCFADHDTLFNREETTGLAQRTRRIYELLGQTDRWSLVTDPGPHGDHRAFDEATRKWFDRHLAGEERPRVERGARDIPQSVTSVFNGCPPQPNHVDLLPQLLSRRGTVPLPQKPEDWPAIRQDAIEALRREVFMPTALGDEKASMEPMADWQWNGEGRQIGMSTHRGEVGGMDVWLDVMTLPGSKAQFVLSVADETQFSRSALGHISSGLDRSLGGYGALETRIAGGRMPAPNKELYPLGSRLSWRTYHHRAMAIAGTTPVAMILRDIRLAVDYLAQLPQTKDRTLFLHGRGDAGVAALYHAVLDERIAGVVLEEMTLSHMDSSPILGVLRVMDIQHALGLMAPRKVALVTHGHKRCVWASCAYERLGCPERYVLAADLREGLAAVMK